MRNQRSFWRSMCPTPPSRPRCRRPAWTAAPRSSNWSGIVLALGRLRVSPANAGK
jgi:hypothetical protein